MLKNGWKKVTAFTISDLLLENQHVGEGGGEGVKLPCCTPGLTLSIMPSILFT